MLIWGANRGYSGLLSAEVIDIWQIFPFFLTDFGRICMIVENHGDRCGTIFQVEAG